MNHLKVLRNLLVESFDFPAECCAKCCGPYGKQCLHFFFQVVLSFLICISLFRFLILISFMPYVNDLIYQKRRASSAYCWIIHLGCAFFFPFETNIVAQSLNVWNYIEVLLLTSGFNNLDDCFYLDIIYLLFFVFILLGIKGKMIWLGMGSFY